MTNLKEERLFCPTAYPPFVRRNQTVKSNTISSSNVFINPWWYIRDGVMQQNSFVKINSMEHFTGYYWKYQHIICKGKEIKMLTACANLISSRQHKQNLLKFAVTEQSTPIWWQAKMYNTKKKKTKEPVVLMVTVLRF